MHKRTYNFFVGTIIVFLFFCFTLPFSAFTQVNSDSVFQLGQKVITLSDVVVDNRLNVPAFIARIENDSSFYKAFKNLRILGYTAINDIRILDKQDVLKASVFSRTKQQRTGNCRSMRVLEETVTGDIYDEQNGYNYYTCQLYASLFFTRDTICGETNIVSGTEFNPDKLSGMNKRKEQLKMLFFNPGRRIEGLPFISGKTELFADDLVVHYDLSIRMDDFKGKSCYVFNQKVKPGHENFVVIDNMTTWFDETTQDVLARNYLLSFKATVYDFNVKMEVEMGKYGTLTVPTLIRYHGNWKLIGKQRERAVFTATLFDFE